MFSNTQQENNHWGLLGFDTNDAGKNTISKRKRIGVKKHFYKRTLIHILLFNIYLYFSLSV